ncbi:MAG: RHS repeat protein [Bacteroidetes bacterium]|nr:RHS repeat protein [Bacteroidota bacterium]
MLIKVTRPDKDEVTFTYDALGRRLSKRYKNTVTKFIWDGNVPLHEWKEHALTHEKLSDTKVGEMELQHGYLTDSLHPSKNKGR